MPQGVASGVHDGILMPRHSLVLLDRLHAYRADRDVSPHSPSAQRVRRTWRSSRRVEVRHVAGPCQQGKSFPTRADINDGRGLEYNRYK